MKQKKKSYTPTDLQRPAFLDITLGVCNNDQDLIDVSPIANSNC
jgi:hypothetical protein